MCFHRVVKVYKRPQPRTIIGYKVFEISGDKEGLGFEHKRNGDNDRVSRGEWERAANAGDLVSIGYRRGRYPVGFHVFLTKAAALLWTGASDELHLYGDQALVKVRAKGILAKGVQSITARGAKEDCVTCEEIFVPEKVYDAAFKRVNKHWKRLHGVFEDEDEDEY